MGERTEIAWCDSTFNPWTGCTKISPGCDHCYAEGWSKRAGEKVGKWGPGAPRVRTTPANWRNPLAWNAAHAEFFAQHGRRQRVFCASLADVFDNEVPPQWRADLFNLIEETPHLDWLLLTKRIGNVLPMVYGTLLDRANGWTWPRNVWLGITVVNQREAYRDIPKLLSVPARVRFLSIEPLLGSVDIRWAFADAGVIRCPRCEFSTNHLTHGPCPNDGATLVNDVGVDWVIVGGESGPDARPAQLQWIRSIVQQCKAAGVPVLVKQLGREVLDDGMSSPGEHWPASRMRQSIPRETEADPGFSIRLLHAKGGDWSEWPEDLRMREFPEAPHAG